MIPPPRRHHQEENTDSWLMSYADMVTLLLCFFVIFASASEPKKDKMSALTEGMAGKFGTVDLATPFQGVFRSLQAVVENHQILKDIAIEKGEKAISMEISSLSFYKDKTADFNEKMVPVLDDLVETLNSIQFMDYQITVEGHTNDVPINNAYFPSNWELSTARAAHMVRFFIDHGIKRERVRAVGYADTRPKVPNLDASGNAIIQNRRLNERVVIRVEQVLQ
jgi:chemotaxis protein MotB